MQSTRKVYAARRGAKVSATDKNSEARAVFREQFRKTELCRFYQHGCIKGSTCSFAHGESELRIAPELTKTSLCQDWIDRRCPLAAEACQFAHGWSDMRTTPAFVEYGARQSKKSESQASSSCEALSINGEAGNVAETPQPAKPHDRQKRATRRSATMDKPDPQTGSDASLSASGSSGSSGSSQGSPTLQNAGFDAQAAGQPAMLMGHVAVMLQPWGAMPGELPPLPLQLTPAVSLQPQLPHPLMDNQAMEALLRHAMPDHYDD